MNEILCIKVNYYFIGHESIYKLANSISCGHYRNQIVKLINRKRTTSSKFENLMNNANRTRVYNDDNDAHVINGLTTLSEQGSISINFSFKFLWSMASCFKNHASYEYSVLREMH